jgi:cytochrome oxidase assembly protein ShyY1
MAGGDERQGGRIPVLSGFRPQFWPTVVAIPAVLVLLGLGVWQVERLHWKEGLIAQRQAALAAAPVAPPRSAEAARGLDFHPVIAEGVFWHDREIFLHATAESGRVGYHVYTPLMTDDGRVIFVNRGFIPTELRDPATRAAGQVAGQVRVQGLLRLPPAGRPGWLLPDNDPRQNHCSGSICRRWPRRTGLTTRRRSQSTPTRRRTPAAGPRAESRGRICRTITCNTR